MLVAKSKYNLFKTKAYLEKVMFQIFLNSYFLYLLFRKGNLEMTSWQVSISTSSKSVKIYNFLNSLNSVLSFI